MSELIKLAEIIAKNLSDAFLSMASDFRKLNDTETLSQASEKPNFASIEPTKPTKLFTYQAHDRIIVKFENPKSPTKYRILKRHSETEYLAYQQRGLKRDAIIIKYDQILGLDPDK